MSEFLIVDAHLHLWDPDRFRMSWLDSNQLLNRAFTLDEYRQATDGLPVVGMVYLQVEVETAYAVLEAQWAAERASEDPHILGIVPWAPVEYGERVHAFLDALTRIGPKIKGVRRIVQFEPEPAFCLRPDFVRGVQLLPEYGLSFDICVKGEAQLDNTIKLVSQCMGTSFILDHIGKPEIAAGILDPWRRQIRELASFPNVTCKVSGLVTEAAHHSWTPAQLAPYVAHVLEVFGEDRVVFGGDWPVALQASPYRRWVDTLASLTANLSDTARRKLWGENARRFYRLE
jgi:L-fuconolactonase